MKQIVFVIVWILSGNLTAVAQEDTLVDSS